MRAQGSTVTVMLGAMAELLQQQPPRPDDPANPLELAIMAPLALILLRSITRQSGHRTLH